jgi:hypothetical protein
VNILVFEFFPFHAQNFPMYERWLPVLLRSACPTIRYYAHPALLQDLCFPPRDRLVAIPPSRYWRRLLSRTGGMWAIHEAFVRREIRRHRPHCVVLNTVEAGRSVQLLARLQGVRKIALLHNPDKLILERRADTRYLCMNDYIFHNLHSHVPLDGYMLSFFPPVSFSDTVANAVPVVGVPGGVSFKRRDYPMLVEIAREWRARPPVRHAVFNIISEVGFKEGAKLRDRVEEAGVGKFFRFHARLTDADFARQIYESDYLLPLVGGVDPSYLREKNSATFSHAARYGKPMLLTGAEAEAWEVPRSACGVYEDREQLRRLLEQVADLGPAWQQPFRDHVAAKLERNREALARIAFDGEAGTL